MSKRFFPPAPILCGLALTAVGYVERTVIGHGARPYAYISVMAVGAMCVIFGALLRRDG